MRLPVAACALLIATIVSGCADGSPAAPLPGSVTVLNATPDSVGYIALDFEVATRADPNPEFAATTLGDRILAPGEEKPLYREDVIGYRAGASVTFWIYEIRGGRAYFSGSMTVPPRRDRPAVYQVVIQPPVYYI